MHCDDDCDCDDCDDALLAKIVSGAPEVQARIALLIQLTEMIGTDDDDAEISFEPISSRKRTVN